MAKDVKLGKSDLYVNPIGQGTNSVGGHNLFTNLDEEAREQLVHTAIKNGINLIVTVFGPGRTEELVGEVVEEIGK